MTSPSPRARLRSDGRWGGAVTRRALPDGADEIGALGPATRARLARIWLSQAATELRVASSFAVIHRGLVALDADAGLVRLAARAVDDEHRHATLAEELAGRYAGRAVGPPPVLPDQRPGHPTASSPALRSALWVVGQCALNETFASAYLSAGYQGARHPLARAALRELLEDEIDHARIGWAYLGTTSPALRRELSDWLLPLTVCNLREWRRLELPEDDALAAHGVPPLAIAREALEETLREVLVPGFRRAGLDTRALERWIAAGAYDRS
ncbi:MAG: hypothetical protein H6719_06920 [Sandaracinaceae bacterium]|nr:hypothetical protein [Sandaracinaceae bacterium]